jgi:predicted XRE-type DNA-binding protein
MTGAAVQKRKIQLSAKGRTAFQELGFQDAEASELLRKSELMAQLEQYVSRNGITQAKAAQVFGVSQPRVSDLMNGKLSVFSLDELVRMYEATGSRIRLVFQEDARNEERVLQMTQGVQPATSKKRRR